MRLVGGVVRVLKLHVQVLGLHGVRGPGGRALALPVAQIVHGGVICARKVANGELRVDRCLLLGAPSGPGAVPAEELLFDVHRRDEQRRWPLLRDVALIRSHTYRVSIVEVYAVIVGILRVAWRNSHVFRAVHPVRERDGAVVCGEEGIAARGVRVHGAHRPLGVGPRPIRESLIYGENEHTELEQPEAEANLPLVDDEML